MRTLVLGIGNPILGDDGVGYRVARELAGVIKDENIDVKDTAIDGLNLLELMAGYDRVIVVDAIMAGGGEVGRVYRLGPDSLVRTAQPATSPHTANLATAIQIGRRLLGEQMPSEVIVFAVSIPEVTWVTEEMTAGVEGAVPDVVGLILAELTAGKAL